MTMVEPEKPRLAGSGAAMARLEGISIILWGALANLALVVAKAVAGWLGGSRALLADAAHEAFPGGSLD